MKILIYMDDYGNVEAINLAARDKIWEAVYDDNWMVFSDIIDNEDMYRYKMDELIQLSEEDYEATLRLFSQGRGLPSIKTVEE
jgi:hypothetical protein